MTNHTPGPWIIDEQYIVADNDEVICQWGSYSKEANAQLIAAAPDMFEEIKTLRAALKTCRELREFDRAQIKELKTLI